MIHVNVMIYLCPDSRKFPKLEHELLNYQFRAIFVAGIDAVESKKFEKRNTRKENLYNPGKTAVSNQ